VKLRLEMPFIGRHVRWARVARWHASENDTFGFGTDLCDVLITEFSTHADPNGSARFCVRITAAESGVLQSIHAAEGFRVEIGDLLGVVATDPAELDGPLPDDALALRVVTDEIDEEAD
jgi:pyruvate/2-oxoglutarate dehydrogenase complex dihydrolipoamide acyltransferase (E2) component